VPGGVIGRPVRRRQVDREEVKAMEVTTMEWETPEFEEIGTSAEVTAYAGIWPESE
jgi:coenzyme PQQ precursor peptide PqqA